MDFQKEILAEHSKKQTLRIVEFIGEDQDKFNNFITLLYNTSPLIAQRSSWVVSYCSIYHPDLIKPHLSKLIKNLKQLNHDAVKRNTLRLLQDIDIPKKYTGELIDTCFTLATNSASSIAIKAFAISILYKLCINEPDLLKELKIIIEDHMPYSSPAFTSRGKKILEKINKKGL